MAISDDEALGDSPAKRIKTKRHRFSGKTAERPSGPNQDSNDIEQAVLAAEKRGSKQMVDIEGHENDACQRTMNLFSRLNIHEERKEWSWRSARAVPMP